MASTHEKLLHAFHNYFFSRHREILYLEFSEPKVKRIKKAKHTRQTWPVGPLPQSTAQSNHPNVILEPVTKDLNVNQGFSSNWSPLDVTSLAAHPTEP